MTELELQKIDLRPLSVNEAWQGRRFKTKAYKEYEKNLLSLLPQMKAIEKPYSVIIYFYFGSPMRDIDNPVKLILDVMQKKWKWLNDRDIIQIKLKKFSTDKGNDHFYYRIESFNDKNLK